MHRYIIYAMVLCMTRYFSAVAAIA